MKSEKVSHGLRKYLPLDEAVEIAHREWGIDKAIAKSEFEQKVILPWSKDYDIGFIDALIAVRDMTDKLIKEKEKEEIENHG